MSARYIVGDVFEVLATLPDDSVDLVFGSPPFLALRSYLPADHPLKDREIGSEATPADFLDTLLDVVEACDRVLAPHGSLCFELGDTFAGSGGSGGDYLPDGLRSGQPVVNGSQERGRGFKGYDDDAPANRRNVEGGPWPLAKSLCGIPTLFAWSLAYGRNLLRPERTTPRWRIRNVVVWARPNPPVGALGDKFRPATSYLTVACKSDKRWFDLDAVRNSPEDASRGRTSSEGGSAMSAGVPRGATGDLQNNPAGAPPLDYWEIPTQPFPGSHYATMPAALIVKPVASMCPQRVCKICGEPSRRIVETERIQVRLSSGAAQDQRRAGAGREPDPAFLSHGRTDRETLGWTDCNHNDWRAGVVLDCFAGSGTTLAVATGHGRDAIGIDLDESNAELALERVGPLFLTVETLEGTEPFAPPAEDVETEIV